MNYNKFPEPEEKTPINVLKLLGYAQEILHDSAVSCRADYKMHYFQFGGGSNRERILVTEPEMKINLGGNKLCIKKIMKTEYLTKNAPEEEILFSICKKYNIKTKKEKIGKSDEQYMSNPELLDKILTHSNAKNIFYTLAEEIPFEKLKNISNFDWEALLHDYLTEGLERDSRIILTYKSDLIRPTFAIIKNSRDFMTFNSNELIFTGTKTAKSTLSEKTGIRIDRASFANLAGFGTANKKQEGYLNGETKTISLDEIQETNEENQFGLLLNYLETGKIQTNLGIANIFVEGLAGLRWQGNPKRDDFDEYTEEDLFFDFLSCIRKVTDNFSAFGSRCGFIFFTNDTKPLSMKGLLEPSIVAKNKAIVECVLEKARVNFSKLYHEKEIWAWLNKDLEDHYIKSLESIEKQKKFTEITKFINGHRTGAGRKIRGKALKLACVDYAIDIAKDTHEIKFILKKAEEYLQDILEVNISSFVELADVSQREKLSMKFIQGHFKKLPTHLKELCHACKELLEDGEEFELGYVAAHFERKNASTMSKKAILERVMNSVHKNNAKLKIFGLEILLTKPEKLKIKDKNKLLAIWKTEED